MNDPKRLLDEVDSHLARELLNAGRWSPWPPGVRRQRVLTALGVGLAVGTTKKLSFAAMTSWSKVAALGCVVCVGAGGVVAYQSVTDETVVTTVSVGHNDWDRANDGAENRANDGAENRANDGAENRANDGAENRANDGAENRANDGAENRANDGAENRANDGARELRNAAQVDNAAQFDSKVPAERVKPSARVEAATDPVEPTIKHEPAVRVSTVARVGVAKNERKDSKVRAELTLLEQARSELRSGRSEAAVATLGTYGQRFPRGVLALEAEVLRIEALAAAGKTQEAAIRAERVLERHPNSVVASRLKRFEAPR